MVIKLLNVNIDLILLSIILILPFFSNIFVLLGMTIKKMEVTIVSLLLISFVNSGYLRSYCMGCL